MFLQHLAILEEHAAALQHWSLAPGRECPVRSFNCGRDFLRRAARYLGHGFPGGGILLDIFGATGDDRLSVDVKRTGLKFDGSCGGHGNLRGINRFYTASCRYSRTSGVKNRPELPKFIIVKILKTYKSGSMRSNTVFVRVRGGLCIVIRKILLSLRRILSRAWSHFLAFQRISP